MKTFLVLIAFTSHVFADTVDVSTAPPLNVEIIQTYNAGTSSEMGIVIPPLLPVPDHDETSPVVLPEDNDGLPASLQLDPSANQN